MMLRRALIVFVLAAPLFAHEGLHEQIAQLTGAIRKQPRNAELYLRRGELHRLHREWTLAARDYDRAEHLDPTLAAVHLGRGMLHVDRGEGAEAIAPLRRYVEARGDDSRGHVALARALAQAGKAAEAAEELERAVAMTPRPDADLVLELARALVAAKRSGDALRVIDASDNPVVTLQLAAIDIEVAAGNYEAALRRIDAATPAGGRKETWMARRGDVLLRAGRGEEARAAYQSALDAIAALPDERRLTRAVQELEERLRRALR